MTIALLLLAEIISYVFFGQERMASTLFKCSNGGWEGGVPKFAFFCIPPDTWDPMTTRQQTTISRMLAARGARLYRHPEEIPEADKRYDERRRAFDGYRNGSIDTWTVDSWVPLYFHASYGQYTARLAAYWSSGHFIWIFGFWIRVKSGETTMA